MNVPRNDVTTALFNLLNGCYPWVTSNIRLRLPQSVPSGQQPSMFLAKIREEFNQTKTNYLTSYTLHYMAFILVKSDSLPGTLPSAESEMDQILDAIDSILFKTPQGPGMPQTLGGLVTNCWIEGEVLIDSPVLFSQCAIWIPINVLTGV